MTKAHGGEGCRALNLNHAKGRDEEHLELTNGELRFFQCIELQRETLRFLFTRPELTDLLFVFSASFATTHRRTILCLSSNRTAIGWMLQNQGREIPEIRGQWDAR